jgi:DNA (cytosine-5)-methyltransferase 1
MKTNMRNTIPVVDLFAGAGGLGEGFAALPGDCFSFVVSVEVNPAAHETLRLRAFYRRLMRKGPQFLRSYYAYCNGTAKQPWDESNQSDWLQAGEEAQPLRLGTQEGNDALDAILDRKSIGDGRPWVLIGGPPCQAYSLVGRSRNSGNSSYKAENDNRLFLYREFRRIIAERRPDAFVMENVEGLLSAELNGERLFPKILTELANPEHPRCSTRPGYRIFSLCAPTKYESGTGLDEIDPRDFLVEAEKYGIPQARHRVILLGIREDIAAAPKLLSPQQPVTVEQVIGDLPALRSKLSKHDSNKSWAGIVGEHFRQLAVEALQHEHLQPIVPILLATLQRGWDDLDYGRDRLARTQEGALTANPLENWYHDSSLNVWLQHEARGHMPSDLRRYAFASAYAMAFQRSPKGHKDFCLSGLTPSHANWKSKKFQDRFRVQLAGRPSLTITSHIAKDGHYFIHYDPRQCRSLTVREAARLQTFPDNYYFEGNRTEQRSQVGNAVPPLLAMQIAKIVDLVINSKDSEGQRVDRSGSASLIAA